MRSGTPMILLRRGKKPAGQSTVARVPRLMQRKSLRDDSKAPSSRSTPKEEWEDADTHDLLDRNERNPRSVEQFWETSRKSRTQIEGSTCSRLEWDCGPAIPGVFCGSSNPLVDFVVKAGIQHGSAYEVSDGEACAARVLARSVTGWREKISDRA